MPLVTIDLDKLYDTVRDTGATMEVAANKGALVVIFRMPKNHKLMGRCYPDIIARQTDLMGFEGVHVEDIEWGVHWTVSLIGKGYQMANARNHKFLASSAPQPNKTAPGVAAENENEYTKLKDFGVYLEKWNKHTDSKQTRYYRKGYGTISVNKVIEHYLSGDR